MVDFQSRDTRRSKSVTDSEPDEDDGASDEPVADGEEASADTAAPETTESEAADEQRDAFGAAVVTVSDRHSHENDPAGEAVVEALEGGGHAVVTREILRRNLDGVQSAVDALTGRSDVQTVVTVGGIGVEPDDVTVEAVHPLVDKGLPGFGEQFRSRYAERVGIDVVGTRATAGIVDDTPVFCLPADPDGARLGTSDIVVEQAPKLAERAAPQSAEERE